ncbi:hypothetical protein AGABI1DRAFT_107774 [Agaricus bisporus var. burnettii JB137-S8]|uniref:Nephrocystin 3-like N-terminal domain-containing protein n=1 Tax=Agaricus bisporus var. burnettii (strain JB137-S8 / ATCC MYA-4627 / FGSC 10392) TaxID=597362 RepID=K5X498_AGABU|nr:uncharacterized protein AGABI1DRAFT_107774 [Agaricus bisporus var. burnettii JB137-S8]EKM78003.1 hypothetical protein AGABI1DRAFT_107774 [Agaricus bisporus var. burnettii JB137-S8]
MFWATGLRNQPVLVSSQTDTKSEDSSTPNFPGMPHNSSSIPAPPSPNARSTPPVSPRYSPLPSTPSSGHDAERSSSDNYLSTTSAYDPPRHPLAISVTRCHPVPPSPISEPVDAMQASTPTHLQAHSTYPAYMLPQPPPRLPRVSPQNLYYTPDTNFPYIQYPEDHIPVHSLPNFQPPHTSRSSVTAHISEDSNYQNLPVHQLPLHAPQGQASAFETHSHYARYQSQGMFSGSHNLSFSDNTFIDNSATSDNFMKEFLLHTIIGAEFDSSARHPPPRCHPGTRLLIIERCKTFIVQCNEKEKMRWVVGAAGVGKSAIMQIIAEDPPDGVVLGASVFLSVNGRQDGTKICMTIAYQLAAKCEPYRQFIRQEISRDPSLLQKSMPAQFQKFFVDPFIRQRLFNPSHRLLIIIDGLDECDNPLTQRELLGLISHFCIKYPTCPVVWFIASRPEPHITSFFGDVRVAEVYTKEEVTVDSDEASEDVQLYLRDELKEIKFGYSTLRRKREWPSELEFTKIAAAAGGLFAYASTIVRYIGDPLYRDPATQLRRVLKDIDTVTIDDASGRDHPMAQLDALYQRILSNIPADTMINTRKLLLVYSAFNWQGKNFRLQCNRLGLTEDIAYGAVRHLYAVAKVPEPNEADYEDFEYFHKSFPDFLLDFKRSRFFHDVEDEADQLLAQASFRIIEQVPNDFHSIAGSEVIACYPYGYLRGVPGFCDNISLSWPGDEHNQITDDHLRFGLYLESVGDTSLRFGLRRKPYWTIFYFHVLMTRFTEPGYRSPFYQLRDAAFDEFRPELTALGKLKQVPLRTLDYAAICGRIDFEFVSPTGVDVKFSDPWSPSCKYAAPKGGHGWFTVARLVNTF